PKATISDPLFVAQFVPPNVAQGPRIPLVTPVEVVIFAVFNVLKSTTPLVRVRVPRPTARVFVVGFAVAVMVEPPVITVESKVCVLVVFALPVRPRAPPRLKSRPLPTPL